VEVSGKTKGDFEKAMKGKICSEIGNVTRTPRLLVRGLSGGMLVDASLNDLVSYWNKTLRNGV
jgi:hypothetical protein